MTSPIYWHPKIYETVMRLLYRGSYGERIKAVADRIPNGCSVADVCAGDCSLYRYGLKDRGIDYRAFDINPIFVRWANGNGIPMERIDLRVGEFPPADCVVMLSSLYQFIPNQNAVLEKLIASARKQVVVTEPIHNVAQNKNPIIRWLGKNTTQVGDNQCAQRFDESTLRALLSDCGFQTVVPIAKGRELLAIKSTNTIRNISQTIVPL